MEAKMSKTYSNPSNISVEGSLLPADLLHRIINADSTLEGLRPTDYHLGSNERLGEAATRAWTRLLGLWPRFKESIAKLPLEATGTTETRERWLLYLFQELGYGRLQTPGTIEVDDKSYRISHKATEPVAIHLVSCKWDLDRRNAREKSSPHGLMQECINRSPHHLWGFLSNGYKLRILRDNLSLTRTSYIEFDLQAIMDGNAYSDFFLLYLLCHQSRVEVEKDENGRELPPDTCWLEKWYNTSIKEGVRALDDLRNSVKSAIEALAAGFLAHPANTTLKAKLRSGELDKQSYYHQVLMLVYRLLFIFVAEDRDLLIPEAVPENVKQTYNKYYATHRIRELAYKQRGSSHTDLWQQVEILFKGLAEGNATLGLPALGSFLFRPSFTPDLTSCHISNNHVLRAFLHLCYIKKDKVFQLINYRNLGHEELGSVYEALLEMRPDIDVNSGIFKLNIVSGSDRKTTGSYYTPSSLINQLLDTALKPVLNSALKGKKDIEAQQEAILNLKICDPACGSGHFLIAAAHRLAKRLAAIRSGEEEPAPSDTNRALREVIGNCIYGVDLNPMAVELCKVSLWMEALEPGKPLTFLDHHIQCGNSLLGCTPELLREGIPDKAFEPITGDDKQYCLKYKKRNAAERKGIIDIFSGDGKPWEHLGNHTHYMINLNKMDDDSLESLQRKEAAYAQMVSSSAYLNSKFIYDAWCAAFVWIKAPSDTLPYPITQQLLDNIDHNPYSVNPAIRAEVMRLAEQYRFFHWHIAFPEVFPYLEGKPAANFGFDCVLGNPPWELNELKEREWFAGKDDEIADAKGKKRSELMANLNNNNPALYKEYLDALRHYHATSLLYNQDSGLYSLCGKGKINYYSIFAELNLKLLSKRGYCGCIVPSGIATDNSTKDFFQEIVKTGSLASLYNFENSKPHFPEVDRRFEFCLLTLKSNYIAFNSGYEPADFVFYAYDIEDLKDAERHFQLSAKEIALINPNTGNCPIFRCKQDAELTKYIYNRVPILINENDTEHGNPWSMSCRQGLFNTSIEADILRTKVQLEEDGFILEGNLFVKDEQCYLPLFESKMIHHFNHRFGDFTDLPADSRSTKLPDIPLSRLRCANYEPLPRDWVEESLVLGKVPHDRKYLLGFRKVTGSTNERTVLGTVMPWGAAGDGQTICFSDRKANELCQFVASMSSFACDFVSRFKVGGINLNIYIFKQLAVPPPEIYTHEDNRTIGEHIIACALELFYTSYSIRPFARDCAYDGPPFIWDEERRFELRCELDAIFFHLYLGDLIEWQAGASDALLAYLPTPRQAIEYIMSTFPIVKRKDEKEYGEYRTLRRILEIYDDMMQCLADGREYRSHLNPPPGPPCDAQGNYLPVAQWDRNNWPSHIHKE